MTMIMKPKACLDYPRQVDSPGSKPTSLEQILRDFATLANGPGSTPVWIDPADFETWSGGGASYLEAHLEATDLPPIDLSFANGCLMIRVAWPSSDVARGGDTNRGGDGGRQPA